MFILIFINPQYTVLHILSHCTFYSFYYLFLFSFLFSHIHIYIYIYIYILSCYVSLFFIFLHCPLSGPVLTYISLLIIPCMIVYVTNNKEPWSIRKCSNGLIWYSGNLFYSNYPWSPLFTHILAYLLPLCLRKVSRASESDTKTVSTHRLFGPVTRLSIPNPSWSS